MRQFMVIDAAGVPVLDDHNHRPITVTGATYDEVGLLDEANRVRLTGNPFDKYTVTTVPGAVMTLEKGLPARLGGCCWIVLELLIGKEGKWNTSRCT